LKKKKKTDALVRKKKRRKAKDTPCFSSFLSLQWHPQKVLSHTQSPAFSASISPVQASLHGLTIGGRPAHVLAP